MASIFQRIQQKAQSALTGIGNTIDRDQSMGGVQLAQGGLMNRIGQAAGNVARSVSNTPASRLLPGTPQTNSGPTIGDAGRFVQDFVVRPAPRAIQTLSSTVGQAIGADDGVTSPEEIASAMPYKPARDFFYGENPDPILSLQNQTRNNAPGVASFLQDRGVSPDLAQGAATPLTFLGAGTLAAMDAIPGDPTDLLKGGGKAAVQEGLPLVDDAVQTAIPFFDDAAKAVRPIADDLVAKLPRGRRDFLATENGIVNLAKSPRTTASIDNALDFLDTVKSADDTVVPEGLRLAAPQPQLLLEAGNPQPTANAGSKLVNRTRGIASKAWDGLMTQTPERLKNVFGKEFYGQTIEPILLNLNTASRKADDFVKVNLESIGKAAEELGVTANTPDSKLLYTLRDEGYDAVVRQVGQERAAQLQVLYDQMRKTYDQVYDIAAPIASRLGKELPRREEFLSQQGNRKLGLDLLGDTSITGETSSSIFKQQGAVDQADPLKAFALYINRAANLIHMEPEASKLNDLAAELSKNKNVSQDMLSELDYVRKAVTGEGKEVSAAQQLFDQYFGKTKAAAVVGKVSTVVNQALGIPAAASNAGWRNFIEGNLDPATRKLVKEKSALFSSVNRSVPESLKGSPLHQRIIDGMAKALQSSNRFGYESSLRGFVKQAEKMGIQNIDEMVSKADLEAARVLGDRREWMTPRFYNTFLGKIIAPFTQEQTAQAASFLQNIGDKKAKTVIKTLISWKLGNEIWKNVSGFSPYFDPIEAAQDTAELWGGSDEKEANKLKAFMRVVEEGLTLAPPVQSMVNQGYSLGETAGILPDSNTVFANDKTWMSTGSLLNPLSGIQIKDGEVLPKNITGNKAVDIGLSVGAKFVPGLEQVNRTVQAANTIKRGYAVSKAGSPMYEAPETLLGKAQALTIGQSSTKNAQDWFNNDFSGYLNKSQKAALEGIDGKEAKLNFLANAQGASETKNKLRSKTDSLDVVISGGAGGSGVTPTTKAEQQAVSEYVNTVLSGGAVPSASDLKQGLFSGKSATSKSIEERMSAYKVLEKTMNDEFLTDNQKQAIVRASGAPPEHVYYYNLASKDSDVRLQEILPKLDAMEPQAVMEYLMQGRRAVGGKQLVSNDMVDYLYENDYINKNQVKAIKALKWDEIKDQPYFSKSYTGAGGALTYAQAKKIFGVELPKFDRLKSLDYLEQSSARGASQTTRKDDILISTLLNAPAQRTSGGSGKLWF